MNSNYMFVLNRNSVAAPRVSARAAPVAARAAPKAAAPAAVANSSDRFSMNRLIHLKSTGGCRSCN